MNFKIEVTAMQRTSRSLLIVLLAALSLAGCATLRTQRKAQVAEQSGNWDDAVFAYMKALEQDPTNVRYRTALLEARTKASEEHFKRGKAYQDAGVLERAMVEYKQAVQLDPTNQYAMVELAKVRADIARRAKEDGQMTLDQLKKKAELDSQPPVLNPRSKEPISLSFPKPVPIFDIYRALGKAFGINIVFDPNLKDEKIAITLKDMTAKKALETLMRAAQHFYKVIDPHTILIAADTPQNRRNYEDLEIQTFFLSNADVKDVMTMLRSLIDARNIAANEQQNAIIVRDTADKVRVAQRIIEANDKSRGEVVVDVELLQVDTSKLRDLGLALSNYQVTQTLDTGSGSSGVRLSDLSSLNQNDWVLSIPSFVYSFIKNSSDAQLLAHPRIRISDGEKATLHIGDSIPIPVTTFNTAQTVGGNIVPITSFQYKDTGIQIEITPRIHHNQEITLKLKIDVSNLSGYVQGSGGQQQPIIGTRAISSTIRLKDGETNLLAGLIRTDDSDTENGIPGLSDIPVLGRLFSKTHADRHRTDLVLTLTPHIIRTANITEQDLLPIWVGTATNFSLRGGSPEVGSPQEGPFGGGERQQIQQMIRRRLEELPRGVRRGRAGARARRNNRANTQSQEKAQPEAPKGKDLANPSTPSNLFEGNTEPKPEKPATPPDQQDQEAPPPGPEPVAFLGAPTGGEHFPGNNSGRIVLASYEPAVAPLAPISVTLGSPANGVKVGSTFSVPLTVDAHEPISHLPATLTYDPQHLAVVGVERGAFFGGPASSSLMTDSSVPGRLVVGASRLGGIPGVTGRGELLRITFKALASGPTSIRFQTVKALGPDLRPLAGVFAPPLSLPIAPSLPHVLHQHALQPGASDV